MNRRHRLTGRRRFGSVLGHRRSRTCGAVRVHLAPNTVAVARVGLSVRGMRRSVDRNLLRRRLKAVLALHVDSLAGLDVVVAAGPAALTVPFAELTTDVERCLGQLLPRPQAAGC